MTFKLACDKNTADMTTASEREGRPLSNLFLQADDIIFNRGHKVGDNGRESGILEITLRVRKPDFRDPKMTRNYRGSAFWLQKELDYEGKGIIYTIMRAKHGVITADYRITQEGVYLDTGEKLTEEGRATAGKILSAIGRGLSRDVTPKPRIR